MADATEIEEDRSKAGRSKDGPGKEVDPVKLLDDARAKADRGIELARQITDKLPPGADRDKAETALATMSGVADRLHGREKERDPETMERAPPKPAVPDRDNSSEPDREMKAGALDKNVEKDRTDAAPGLEKKLEPESQPHAPGSGKEFMAKIKARDAEQARERERNPDADRDR